jgi:hypothetical protein
VKSKETFVIILLLGFMLVTACGEATSPPARRQATIYAIQTPQRAAMMDTIRISFQYNTNPCDTAVVFESQLMSDGIRLGVSSVGTDRVCPIAVTQVYRPPFLYVVGPPHQAPFTVRFAERGEADSVRVVAGP